MKKKYINPQTEIIHIETEQMIAESLYFGEDVESASGAEARGGDFWDDDYDEEY